MTKYRQTMLVRVRQPLRVSVCRQFGQAEPRSTRKNLGQKSYCKWENMALPTIAIVGRPNVGKSTLFNRIAGEADLNRIRRCRGCDTWPYLCNGWWLNRSLKWLIREGLTIIDAPFMEQIKHQAEIAMEESGCKYFAIISKEGITDAGRVRGTQTL